MPERVSMPSLYRIILWRCVIVVLTLAITACATSPVVTGPSLPPDLAWQARKTELEKLTSWRLHGRIAIKSTGDSWSASIDWQQQDDVFDIHFMTHLGQTMAKLQGQPGQATLYTPDEKITAADVDELLDKHFGWVIPIEGLRYWILGVPAPGFVANKQVDDDGRMELLEQSGWHIQYVRYNRDGSVDMPEKMVLEYPRLRVRLFIDRWELFNDVKSDRQNPGFSQRSAKINATYVH